MRKFLVILFAIGLLPAAVEAQQRNGRSNQPTIRQGGGVYVWFYAPFPQNPRQTVAHKQVQPVVRAAAAVPQRH